MTVLHAFSKGATTQKKALILMETTGLQLDSFKKLFYLAKNCIDNGAVKVTDTVKAQF
ncbi:MAG: hypothetical protein JSS07_01755 [Proteobacteria bacterium]|nr:hypothetical protein [Pseudomonadota bacterium]